MVLLLLMQTVAHWQLATQLVNQLRLCQSSATASPMFHAMASAMARYQLLYAAELHLTLTIGAQAQAHQVSIHWLLALTMLLLLMLMVVAWQLLILLVSHKHRFQLL